MRRVGLACVQQETNTFAVRPTNYADFEGQCFLRGDAVLTELAHTNTEVVGAAMALNDAGALVVPLLAAWASPGGRVSAETFEAIGSELEHVVRDAMPLDALVFSLHGAMAVDGLDDGDGALIARMRTILGNAPIGVCLDLHANLTQLMVRTADMIVGYHTYPHVDQADTGARVAELVLRQLSDGGVATRLAKRSMLLPAETTSTAAGPMAALRARADAVTTESVLDVSLFAVQPWLDVPDLGFAVTVTAHDDPARAQIVAEELTRMAWDMRDEFDVALVSPIRAIELVRSSAGRPVILTESSDSTSAGAAGDSAAMVGALLAGGPDLRALVTVVDPRAVAQCTAAGVGARVALQVGASIDARFGAPVAIRGAVTHLDDGHFRLSGPVSTGLPVSSGRRAVVTCGRMSVLLTESSAYSYDPAAYRSAGLEPAAADVVVVRSACMFRAGYGPLSAETHVLDTAGASTPRFESLTYHCAPRPLYPLDRL